MLSCFHFQFSTYNIYIPNPFTTNIKQYLQRKVKYTYRFEKLKIAFNLAFNLDYKDKIIGIINGYIK
jgi:hypothetical protein